MKGDFVMILWTLYKAVVALNWGLAVIGLNELEKKVKEEGYVYKDNKDISSFIDVIKGTWPAYVPMLNLIYLFAFLIARKEIVNSIFKDDLANGELLRIEESVDEDKKEEALSMNKTFENVVDKKTGKSYDDMTFEEKIDFLEREREFLIATKTPQEQEIGAATKNSSGVAMQMMPIDKKSL